MNAIKNPSRIAATAVLIGVPVAQADQADNPDAVTIEAFVQRVRSTDPAVRGPAWQEAARHGAEALGPLAVALLDEAFEVPRAAKRALWLIVRHAGRPGAESERHAVQEALLKLLKHEAAVVRRATLWMLSEIGDAGTVEPVAALLDDPAAREDARCALLRLPGPGRTEVLRHAFGKAPEPFKYALADTLRLLGVQVPGYPSQKLIPTCRTTVVIERPQPPRGQTSR